MMYEIVFTAHILGACVTLLVGAFALVYIWNNTAEKFSFVAKILGAIAGFEILSGTALSVLSTQISAASLCSRIFLYLALVIGIEALLFYRMKKDVLAFPVSPVVASILGSLMVFLSALAYGF